MKLSLVTATLFAVSLIAVSQDNIQEVRETATIGQTVTVVGVVTSDDNLGSVRYLQDATAGIAIYPGMDWSGWDQTPVIGDSLSVTGAITEYNGLLEVGPELDARTAMFDTGGTAARRHTQHVACGVCVHMIHIHTHTHARTHTYAHIRTRTHAHTRTHTHTHAYAHAHAYAHIHAHTHTHTHTHTHND